MFRTVKFNYDVDRSTIAVVKCWRKICKDLSISRVCPSLPLEKEMSPYSLSEASKVQKPR
jgi:hypothetical protein